MCHSPCKAQVTWSYAAFFAFSTRVHKIKGRKRAIASRASRKGARGTACPRQDTETDIGLTGVSRSRSPYSRPICRGQPDVPKVQCSEGSMFRRSNVPKVRCSEGSMFRRYDVPKVQCSEGSMFRIWLFSLWIQTRPIRLGVRSSCQVVPMSTRPAQCGELVPGQLEKHYTSLRPKQQKCIKKLDFSKSFIDMNKLTPQMDNAFHFLSYDITFDYFGWVVAKIKISFFWYIASEKKIKPRFFEKKL